MSPTLRLPLPCLPDGTVEDMDFLDSAFFRNKSPPQSLPTLEQVRARALAENADVTQPKPVRFENPSLVVKFGPHVTIAEAQCLRAIKEVLGGQVSVPEVFAWRKAEDGIFI